MQLRFLRLVALCSGQNMKVIMRRRQCYQNSLWGGDIVSAGPSSPLNRGGRVAVMGSMSSSSGAGSAISNIRPRTACMHTELYLMTIPVLKP